MAARRPARSHKKLSKKAHQTLVNNGSCHFVLLETIFGILFVHAQLNRLGILVQGSIGDCLVLLLRRRLAAQQLDSMRHDLVEPEQIQHPERNDEPSAREQEPSRIRPCHRARL